MFERFTKDAREIVVSAQGAARRRNERVIGTEHLLMAVLAQQHTVSTTVLGRHGLSAAGVDAAATRLTRADDLDADALGALGIDLDAVREKVESAFGRGALDRGRRGPQFGHIPFSPRAKKVLELSLREAVRLKHQEIRDGHITLGILREGEGLAAKIITDAGIDVDALRGDLESAIVPTRS